MTFVRDDVRAALDAFALNPAPRFTDVGAPAARQMLDDTIGLIERPAPPMARREDFLIPGPDGKIPARLYQASATGGATGGAAPLVVYYHGGGWALGSLKAYDSLCAEIALLTGWTVVSVDYRLAPEAPFPAGINDALAACRWLATAEPLVGHPLGGIIVAGDSAGGNLAAVVARELMHEVNMLAQWLIYPGTDMEWPTGSMQEFGKGYLLETSSMKWFTVQYQAPPEDPRASPLRAEEWEGLPPALVFACGLDPLRDQVRAYAAKLADAGCRLIYREAAGQIHGCLSMRLAIPSGQQDLVDQVNDLKALLQ